MVGDADAKKLLLPCALSAVGAAVVTYLVLKQQSGSKPSSRSSENQKATESNVIYETDKSTEQYMEFHFTPSATLFEPYDPNMRIRDAFDFTKRVALKFNKFRPRTMNRVLDLGCAVGMSSFELSKSDWKEVVGIDLSVAFIKAAKRVLESGRAEYSGPEQGLRGIPRTFAVDADVKAPKIRFEVGDALAVDPALGTFDGVLAANLVCRVPDPELLLRSFGKLVNPGGILVLVSPYSWWDGATPQEKWIGGKPGCERSEQLVRRILESVGFEHVDETNEPFLIRDHHRRFQLGFSSCTVWRRK